MDVLRALHEALIGRCPPDDVLRSWLAAKPDATVPDLIRGFAQSRAYRKRAGVPAFFPNGHFHSPVVDPATLGDAVQRTRADANAALRAIEVDIDAMADAFEAVLDGLNELDLAVEPVAGRRYASDGSPFPPGDAASLRLMMEQHRPRRIVEIGSGSSTAAALDFADDLALPLDMTCIEPHPARLRSMLGPDDARRVSVIERPVQEVDPAIVAALEPGDVLFIDSTHVLKTGSDVHHELFALLPAIRPGVLVHVHDCPFPFEYPDLWVTERNYSWNEAYALRAFLMFNTSFRIVHWAGMLRRVRPELIRRSRHHTPNPGTSIWIERTS